jgi:hypothetical protein
LDVENMEKEAKDNDADVDTDHYEDIDGQVEDE